MPQKPNVENRWWVETTFKKPKRAESETEMPQLPVAMAFYRSRTTTIRIAPRKT